MNSKISPEYLNLIKPTKVLNTKSLNKDDEALKKVSEEFESIFVKMMLDSADKTIDRKKNMFYGGNSEEVFRSMLNSERSKDLAKFGNYGIAETLYKQLSKNVKNKG